MGRTFSFVISVAIGLSLPGPKLLAVECPELLLLNPNSAKLSQFALFDAVGEAPANSLHPLESFRSQVGIEVTRKDFSGRALEGKIRVLSDNSGNRISILADFNGWGKAFAPEDHLRPVLDTPYFEGHVRKLFDGMEYRLLLNGSEVIDPAAVQYTTPEMVERFRPGSVAYLNSVFSDVEYLSVPKFHYVDFRKRPVLIAESSLYDLAAKWNYQSGTGPSQVAGTYRFIAESGLAKEIAKRGYTHIEFLPFTASVDGAAWQKRYQTFGLFGPDSRYGTPDEFRKMVDAFYDENVGVIMDAVLGHYPYEGNEGVRAIAPIGIHRFINGLGRPLFGGTTTVWNTYRWDYSNPFVRRFLIDSVISLFKRYRLSGIRIDNVDGIRAQSDGNQFLRELNSEIRDYVPQAIVIGEMFTDQTPALTSIDRGGLGFHAANDVDFFYNFVQKFLQAWDGEIELKRLEWFLGDSWRWGRVPMQRWITNHDEAANRQPGASGDYVATLLNGGGWDLVAAKTKIWATLSMVTGSLYLDMPQMRFLQEGNFSNNPSVDWALLKLRPQSQVDDYFTELTRLIRDSAEFLPQNLHTEISNHVDDDNKVASLLRIDFSTGRKTYILVNLGSRKLLNYSFGIDAGRGKRFRVAIGSDQVEFGGQGYLKGAELIPNFSTMHGKTHSLTVPVLAPFSAVIIRETRALTD